MREERFCHHCGARMVFRLDIYECLNCNYVESTAGQAVQEPEAPRSNPLAKTPLTTVRSPEVKRARRGEHRAP